MAGNNTIGVALRQAMNFRRGVFNGFAFVQVDEPAHDKRAWLSPMEAATTASLHKPDRDALDLAGAVPVLIGPYYHPAKASVVERIVAANPRYSRLRENLMEVPMDAVRLPQCDLPLIIRLPGGEFVKVAPIL